MSRSSFDSSELTSTASTPRGGGTKQNVTERPEQRQEQSDESDQERDQDLACPECNTDDNVITDDEETYCKECGFVVDRDDLDRRRRWVDTGDGRERERGAPTTHRFHDKGLSTDIGHYRDGTGRQLSFETRRRFRRLRKWDNRAKAPSKREQNLRSGLGEIARLVSALELSRTVHDRAASLYREAWSDDMLLGRSIEAVASASVFAACRLERLPRPVDEIGELARVETAEVKQSYRLLNRELELATPPPLPKDYVPRIVSGVNAPSRIERRANQLAASNPVGVLANGRRPNAIAAACIYFAYKESGRSSLSITQGSLAEESYTTPTTLRKLWNELEALDEEGELPMPDGDLEEYAE